MEPVNLCLIFTLLVASCLQMKLTDGFGGSTCYNIGILYNYLKLLLFQREVRGSEHPHIYLHLNCSMCRCFFHANDSRKFCDSCLHNVHDNEVKKNWSPLGLLPGDNRRILEWERDGTHLHKRK